MADYRHLENKKVTLTYTDASGVVTADGTVKAVTDHGIQFQPKKGKGALLLNSEIISAEEIVAPEKAPAEVKAYRVDPVTPVTVKRHLAHAHGLALGSGERSHCRRGACNA